MGVRNIVADAGRFTANVYLVDGAVNALVDAGTVPGTVDRIRKLVPQLDAVVLTHQHGDHVGQLAEIISAFDPEVYAYGAHSLRTVELAAGDSLRIGDDRYEVVYTPGHADDHVAFVSDTAVFSGDVVVYNDSAFTGGSFGRTDHPGQSRDQLVQSLKRLLDRLPTSVEAMYPGHGDRYEGDVRGVVRAALERAARGEPKYPDE